MQPLRFGITVAALTLAACAGPDAKLERRVETRLAAEGLGDGVEVSVDDRVVTVSGTVSSKAERDRAEGAAAGIEGVRWVRNELVVPLPPVLSGAEIEPLANLVQRRLAEAGFPEVMVAATGDGVVTLRGAIEPARREAVIKAAREASPQVRRVEDDMLAR